MSKERKTLIIDSHVHIGKDEKYGFELSAEEFIEKMRQAKVDYAVIFACPWTRSGNYVDENLHIVESSRKFDTLFPALFVNPFSRESIEGILGFCKRREGKAIKLHPLSGEYKPRDLLDTDILAIAREYDLPIIIHSGYQDEYEGIIEIAHELPNPIIVSHAFRFRKKLIEEASKIPNIYLDPCPILALLNSGKRFLGDLGELIDVAKEGDAKILFNALYEIMDGRVVWGSDEPWSSEMSFSMGYNSEVELIRQLEERVKQRIMRNAQDIFQINVG